MDKTKFKPNDYVRMKVGSVYYYGQVTIVREDGHCKVMFQDEHAPDYWYYPSDELELMTPEDTRDE